jgi:hypothetical protein
LYATVESSLIGLVTAETRKTKTIERDGCIAADQGRVITFSRPRYLVAVAARPEAKIPPRKTRSKSLVLLASTRSRLVGRAISRGQSHDV